MAEAGAGERIHSAAVELFAARGFHGTGIRDLAAAAGVSSATLYHYMGTKEDLLTTIMRERLTALLDAAAQARAVHADPVDLLGALVGIHVRSHAGHRLETRVVDDELRALSPEVRAEVTALRDRYEDHWREAIEDARAAGTVHVPDPGLARLALIEMCSSVSRWYSPDGPLSPDEVADRYVDLALGLLGARRTAAQSPT